MVVIEGPRFSTRAESQWYARQGFTLVNMTGYPEAVLARELEMCYAAIALVTDLDAGIEAGSGVTAVDVFAEFERNLVPFKKLVHEALGRGARRTHLHPLPAARGRHAAVRAAVRVLLTGAAGFIGSRVGALLRAQGHDVVGVDALLAAAHGPGAVLPDGVHRADVRDADALAPLLAGVDVVCHQAAMVGAGVNAADAPAYGSPQRLRHHGAAGADVRRRCHPAGAGVVDGGVRPGRLRLPRTRAGRPAAAAPRGPRRRGVRAPLPGLRGEQVRWALVAEDAPLRPRSLYAASKTAQEHYALAWCDAVGGSVTALRYHNVYGPGMPRDTPYSGVAAIFRSALENSRAPKVFEDGGQMRDFVHVDDVAAANLAAVEADRGGFTAVNVCSGRPISILEVARLVCRRARRPGAAGHRCLPQRRRPPHRRRPGAGRRGARVHRRRAPGRRAAGVRVRAAAGLNAHARRPVVAILVV